MNPTEGLSDKVQLQRIFNEIRRRWYLLVLLLAVSLLSVEIYVRLKPESYTSLATIEILEEGALTASSSIDPIESARTQTERVLTEAEVLKTKSMLTAALTRMGHQVSYYRKGSKQSNSLYRKSPFSVQTASEILSKPGILYTLDVTSEQDFDLNLVVKGETVKIEGKFGEQLDHKGEKLTINLSEDTYAEKVKAGEGYEFRFVNTDQLVTSLRKGLRINQPNVKAAILQVRFTWDNALFAQDFLSSLIEEYLSEDYRMKYENTAGVIAFIDRQMVNLSKIPAESSQATPQTGNTNPDPKSEAGHCMEALNRLVAEKRLVEIELRSLKETLLQIQQQGPEDIQPYRANALDADIVRLISDLNRLQLEKLNLSAGEAQGIEGQLSKVKSDLAQRLEARIKLLETTLNRLDTQMSSACSQFAGTPGFSREYLALLNNEQVKEQLLSLLLEKKVSVQVSQAAAMPVARLLDAASLPNRSNPNRRVKLLVWSGMGSVLFGLTILGAFSFFDNKIYSLADLTGLTPFTIMGQVEKIASGATSPESIRRLRTHIDLHLGSDHSGSKTVCIASSVDGEGKTFMSAHLAESFASLGKNTLLVDLNLQSPGIHQRFEISLEPGLSDVLNSTATLEEVIKVSSGSKHLYCLPAGAASSNSGDVIQSKAFMELLNKLKEQYDFILLDTPAIETNPDSLFVMKASDVCLYLVRAGFSKIGFLSGPRETAEKYGLKNISLLLNAVDNKAEKKWKSRFH